MLLAQACAPVYSGRMPDSEQQRLDSWKQIAAYLQRNVITVQRWEKQEGLPVHRHSHQKRSSVYAHVSEIDRWRASRKAAPPARSIRRQLLTPSFALTLALCLVLAGNGVKPQPAEAEATGERRILVCSGADCAQKKLSPDVEALLMNNGNYPVLGKLRETLSTGASGGVQWILSPDGSRVAYTLLGGYSIPKVDVKIVNADGSRARTLYHGGVPRAWSPDGKRLLIFSGDDFGTLAWLNLADGRTQKLPPHWHTLKPVVSPDGRYIAFSAAHDRDSLENVIVMTSNGSSESVLSASPAYQVPVGWMPDSKTLIYEQYSEPETLWAATVVNGKLQSTPVDLHAGFGRNDVLLGISRTGALYYSANGGSRSDIYTASMDPVTGKVNSTPAPLPVLNAGSNILPQWAPDSRRLLFLSGDAQRAEQIPHIYSFETGEERVMGDMKARGPGLTCWTHDGASLLFSGPDNPWQISRFNLSNNRVTPLFIAKPSFRLASCSGDWIAGPVQTRLELYSVTTGSTRTLYDAGSESITADVAISRGGRSVAFTTTTIRGGLVAGSPKAIHVVSTAGGATRDVVTVVPPQELQYFSVAWSPDDRFLYFTRRADTRSAFELYRIAVAGGQPESMGLKLDGLRQINIAPDGGRIAFTVGSSGSELWSVEGFLPKR